jgi:ABC-type antimicrobial peptide transport system permease subunit
MRFLLINHIQNARQSLKANHLRSVLTMLGVTIGVASVTAILALSSGASKVVSDQVDQLGGNIAVIRPGAATTDPLGNLIGQDTTAHDYSASTITEDDLSLVTAISNIQTIAPLMILSGPVKADSSAPTGTPIVATTPALASIAQLPIDKGQFLDPAVNQNTAVIGVQLSIDIYGTEDSVGRKIDIRGTSFTIIGVLKRLNNPINYNNVDFDKAVIINFDSGKLLNQSIAQIQQIDMRATSVANLDQVIIDTNKTLLLSHGGQTDFSVLSGTQISQPTSQLFYAIAGVTAVVAGISLLVGGIGIMNIMLVSVAERTREIGIRKALGATNSDITWQFLIESLAISIGGGISGYLIGYGAAFAISTFLTFNPVLNWQIAAVALGISLIMGTIFGLYPAFKASRKDPIDSLREYS